MQIIIIMELVELQSDSFLKQEFLEGGLMKYYTLLSPAKYPALWKNALKLIYVSLFHMWADVFQDEV